MKKILGLIAIALLTSFSADTQANKVIKNSAFRGGERVVYKMRYSVFTAGTGVVSIDDEIHQQKGRPCYRVSVYGSTSNFFDNFLKVRDSWISYVDTAKMIPHRFNRDIREGNYRRTEATFFDQKNGKATVKHKGKKPGWKTKNYKMGYGTQDIISLYTYFRNYDYSKLKKGDTFKVEAFFEDELYEAKIYYWGEENIKTKVGKFKAIKISPVLPKSSVFEGNDAITFWLSKDKNKLLLQAKLKIKVIPGSNAWLEIREYKGLRHKLSSKI